MSWRRGRVAMGRPSPTAQPRCFTVHSEEAARVSRCRSRSACWGRAAAGTHKRPGFWGSREGCNQPSRQTELREGDPAAATSRGGSTAAEGGPGGCSVSGAAFRGGSQK